MSAINATCFPIPSDIESGGGEMKCYKVPQCRGSSTANLIASEVVNDILENALDVAISNTTLEKPKVDKISSNVVGDILENILSTSSTAETTDKNQDDTVLLDDEIKRIIKEMKYPPEQKIPVSTKGVGDQLTNKSEIAPAKVLSDSKRNTLERKNRLTNLVRNSKQMLAKFVANDNEKDLRAVKSEETNEKLLKIIDFDNAEDKSSIKQEVNTKGEREVEKMPPESTMDLVDLENACTASDEDGPENKLTQMEREESGTKKKKKWHIGSKIIKILKKGPKKEEKKLPEEN